MPKSSKTLGLICSAFGLVAAGIFFVRGHIGLGALFLLLVVVSGTGLLSGVQAKIFPNLVSGGKLTQSRARRLPTFWVSHSSGWHHCRVFLIGCKRLRRQEDALVRYRNLQRGIDRVDALCGLVGFPEVATA
jgi:hypothetical protein